jgi:hypothetical protein
MSSLLLLPSSPNAAVTLRFRCSPEKEENKEKKEKEKKKKEEEKKKKDYSK